MITISIDGGRVAATAQPVKRPFQPVKRVVVLDVPARDGSRIIVRVMHKGSELRGLEICRRVGARERELGRVYLPDQLEAISEILPEIFSQPRPRKLRVEDIIARLARVVDSQSSSEWSGRRAAGI